MTTLARVSWRWKHAEDESVGRHGPDHCQKNLASASRKTAHCVFAVEFCGDRPSARRVRTRSANIAWDGRWSCMKLISMGSSCSCVMYLYAGSSNCHHNNFLLTNMEPSSSRSMTIQAPGIIIMLEKVLSGWSVMRTCEPGTPRTAPTIHRCDSWTTSVWRLATPATTNPREKN